MKARVKNTNTGGFLPNILDDYDLPSYNFKLYMLPDTQVYKGNYDSKYGVIIAQSGVTGQIGIDDVQITSYLAPNVYQKNMLMIMMT
jgi:hypothetical protein